MTTQGRSLMRCASGKARGWSAVWYGWNTTDRNPFPRLGWWARTRSGDLYLGHTAREARDACAARPASSTPTRAP